MATQKALLLMTEKGSFALGTRAVPTVAKGELLVKVKAAALNPVDWKIQKEGRAFLKEYPLVLGMDIAGDVVEIGEGARGFQTGDRVLLQGWFDSDYAGFQQYAKVPADITAKIPDSMSYSQAASVPQAFATAAIGLFSTTSGASLNPNFDKSIQFEGQPAVVIGGATSVGQCVIQLLKFSGFSPIITYASAHHTDLLKGLGATHIIDRKSVLIKSLPVEVERVTKTSVKTIYDAVSSTETVEASYATLSEGGDLILVLPTARVKSPVEGKKVHNVFGGVFTEATRPFGRVMYKKLEQFLEDGTVRPNRVEELPNGLAGITDGLERLRNNEVSGKKLVVLPQETP
ncbi:hypothetical protein V5O48_011909 [Marasmius crinis-equi]|uniref:Enoyl reductase (ER) domain-containing protein n=1 Tax=Marasmius crinis-equi TaxID=585013 RepID=A0ABR3F4A4_9AGAR